MAEIAVNYFQTIFTSTRPTEEFVSSCLEGMEGLVTDEMNTALLEDFTEKEVTQALKQMYPTKAPGPDGMSAIFYQTYWEVVGPEVLSNVISESQSAFVPGRLITDNVLVAFEVMHTMSLKRKGKRGHMALKLDMSKVYDRVEWCFLEAIMRKMGFADRSKTVAFSEIKGRVWRRMHGWKEKFLSMGGREVLIKAVAQSIPTYTMSCFKIPDGLCKDLNAMFSDFWWGHHDKAKKAHWLRWSKLCHSKDSGGMGFRDLKAFNLAMLAKQGWRLIQNPHSLISRVFKAKYFPHGEFLEANIGYRPSYAWRSIALARETLKLGLCWHIGDGQSVRIHSDPWNLMSGAERLYILFFRTGMLSSSVPFLFLLGGKPDRLFWNATTTGLFSVRSAYFLQFQRGTAEVEGECSSVGREKKFWKFLWALSLPPKVKVFLWRACIGILPTHDLLWRRHMRRDDCCSCCFSAVDSVCHALWTCPAANDVCEINWFMRVVALNPVGVVRRARSLLQSFKLSLPQVGHIDRVEAQQSAQGDADLRWEAPKAGEYKVNWEVCKDSGSNVWYVGVLIRNHVGRVMACLCSPVMALPRGLNPRVGACIHALKFALELGFLDICLEGPHVNSLEVGSSFQIESIADMWNEEVWVFIQRFHHFTMSSSTDKVNRETLGLAQLGPSFVGSRVWIEEVPSQILRLM
uniref:Reverse transcriptase zinc-binding domain-containing protein n=1 Tax=Fagus sylvatica TaxID=28930 RepID=A0A2N9G3J3_FAGSY